MSRKFRLLDSEAQNYCGKFLGAAMDLKLNVFLTHTNRDFQIQDNLYSDSRLNAKQKLTNALAGWSFHNYNKAWDVGIRKNNKELLWDKTIDLDNDSVPEWDEVGIAAGIADCEWAGNWKSFKEKCHLQVPNLNLKILQKEKFLELTKYIANKSPVFDYHIQQVLKKMGLYRYKIDGIVGTGTKKAISDVGLNYKKGSWLFTLHLYDKYLG